LLPNIGFYGKKFGRGIFTPSPRYLSHGHLQQAKHNTHEAHNTRHTTATHQQQLTITNHNNINQQPLLTNNTHQQPTINNIINKHTHMIHKIRQKDAEYFRPIFSLAH